jgi:hypothetical protein
MFSKSTCPDEVQALPALMRIAEEGGKGRESGFIQPLRLGVAKSAYALLEKKVNSCTWPSRIILD